MKRKAKPYHECVSIPEKYYIEQNEYYGWIVAEEKVVLLDSIKNCPYCGIKLD